MVVLDGAKVEIAAVENPQNDPADTTDPRSETLIGSTTDSIEIERNPNTAEWLEHNVGYEQRRELQESGEVSTVFLMTATLDNLLDANLVEENVDMGIYQATKNFRHDAMEYHVYDPHEDVVQQTYRAYDAQPVLESTELDIEGVNNIEATLWLNGPHGYVSDIATVDQTTV